MTSGSYEYLRSLAHALFYNLLLFYELIGKCYLSFCGVGFPNTHQLTEILALVKRTMFKNKHNDSLFHLYINYEFQTVVEHINTLPSGFKEQYVKYDDNQNDFTLIVFNPKLLNDMGKITEIGCEYVVSFWEYENGNTLSFFNKEYSRRRLHKQLIQMIKERERNFIDF